LSATGSGAGTPKPRDSSLQAERTALSWSRTAMSCLVNALLVLRTGLANERTAITTLAVVLLIAAGALFVFSAWRRKNLLQGTGDVAPPALAPALTALVTMVGVRNSIASSLR
jgi:uncharacterized membrane protein YidH (DUF202 family)